MKIISVSKEKTDAFSTISEALSSIPKNNQEPVTIQIAPGTYYEKLTISAPNITLCGDSSSNTIITYDDYARFIMPDGIKRGTFRSYTLFVDADNVTLQNLTIANTSGPSKDAGQAIALYADGDYFTCEDCRLTSCQDTLFTGPLPEKEYEPGGFRGPKEFAPRRHTRGYYKNCYICGDIDFIFGSGTAYFDTCTIHSVLRDSSESVQGYVTAASTPADQDYGYVFCNCDLTSDCPAHSVYLGRPWRDYAKTVYLNCKYDSHIQIDGFHDWNKENARETIFYAEYNCSQNGVAASSINRAPYVHTLSFEEASLYQKERILNGWNPN